MDKILLISMSRSGTSHLSNEVNEFFKINNESHLRINQEILLSDHWKCKSKSLPYLALKKEISACGYDFSNIVRSDKKIKNTILSILKEKEQYIFKYCGGNFSHYVNNTEMLELVDELKLNVVFLYRENILDKALSHIIIESYGYIARSKDATMDDNFFYTENSLDVAIWGYKSFNSLYKTFGGIANTRIIKYSDLKFDGTDHHMLFDSETVIPVLSEKIVNEKVKKKLLKTAPEIKEKLLKILTSTEHDLIYDENLNYKLPGSL